MYFRERDGMRKRNLTNIKGSPKMTFYNLLPRRFITSQIISIIWTALLIIVGYAFACKLVIFAIDSIMVPAKLVSSPPPFFDPNYSEKELYFPKLPKGRSIHHSYYGRYIWNCISNTGNSKRSKSVIHITKEFYNAKYGGIGTLVTSLVDAQITELPSNSIVHVIMPLFSFLRQGKEENNQSNRNEYNESPMYRIGTVSLPVLAKGIKEYNGPDDLINLQVPIFAKSLTGFERRTRAVVWYIGPPIHHPQYPEFDDFFMAESSREIYPPPGSRKHPNSWKDLYFAAATRHLLRDPIFNPDNVVLHVHGATNALSIEPTNGRQVVYTFHDDTFEFDFVLSCSDILLFFPVILNSKNNYGGLCDNEIRGHKFLKPYENGFSRKSKAKALVSSLPLLKTAIFLNPSLYGLHIADAVTCVSDQSLNRLIDDRTMPSSFSGNHVFRFQPNLFVTVRNILQRKINNSNLKLSHPVYVVPNGLSLIGGSLTGRMDPFSHSRLVTRNLHFRWPGKGSSDGRITPSIHEQKVSLKRLIVKEYSHILQSGLNQDTSSTTIDASESETWVLFVGRFTAAKGIDSFQFLYKTICENPLDNVVRIILMGEILSQGAYQEYVERPVSSMQGFCHQKVKLSVISNEELQKRHGVLVRAASDLAWVPSREEAFGLVGLEALLYGMPVLSTGVGGMAQYLRNWIPGTELHSNDYESGKSFMQTLHSCKHHFSSAMVIQDYDDDLVNQMNITRKSCFSALKSQIPISFNAFLYSSDEGKTDLKDAWTNYKTVNSWLQDNPFDREILYWSCIAGSLGHLWNSEPDGPLNGYFFVYFELNKN